MQNPYDTLGVSQQSNDADIKKAYRKMAMQYHPDKGGDDKKFAEINNAYDSIKDADSRMQFEQSQHNPSNFQQSQNAFSQNFGNFNDIFNQMFTQNVRQRPPTSIVYHVEIEDVFNSATKNLNISLPNSSITKPVKITIPKGILSGQEVIYQGMSPNGGDLIVKFIIKQKEGYYVVKHDVIQKLEISLKEAMIGTERIIQTLDKKQIKLQIKSGTQSGTKLRIPQCGLPRSNLPNGDFIIEVYVKIPKLVNKDLDKTFNQVL